MDSNSDNEDICSSVKAGSINPELPEKSKKRYETVFKSFMDWRIENNMYSYSEKVLLAYFVELSKKYKSSSLSAFYSMLKSTLSINEGIDIERYHKLRSFLKHKSESFQPKSAKSFTSEEINKFINEAPDEKFLATKVGLIMGVMGACRTSEMYAMKTEHLEDLEVAFLVTVPNATSETVRKFTITGNFYEICKRYIELRPSSIRTDDFFYQKNQKIGIHRFSSMWKQIAIFLNLPNPEDYSGQSFRRSTSRLLVDTGDKITALKGNMNSITTTEDYIQESIETSTSETKNYINEQVKTEKQAENDSDESFEHEVDAEHVFGESGKSEMELEHEICDKVKQTSKNSNSKNSKNISMENENFRFDVNSLPILQFTNCSNINIYFGNKKVS